jgi:hypothetical protein
MIVPFPNFYYGAIKLSGKFLTTTITPTVSIFFKALMEFGAKTLVHFNGGFGGALFTTPRAVYKNIPGIFQTPTGHNDLGGKDLVCGFLPTFTTTTSSFFHSYILFQFLLWSLLFLYPHSGHIQRPKLLFMIIYSEHEPQ